MTLDERCHTLDMVDVLMGQQYSIQIINRQAQSSQQCGQATHGHTEVNQYVSAVERKQSAVSRRTAGQAIIKIVHVCLLKA